MRVLRYLEPHKADLLEVDDPKAAPNQALVKNVCCNVSAGTEMAFYRGTAPQINSEWLANGLWVDKPGNLTYPMDSSDPDVWWMGYASVGEVVEVGSELKGVKKGDIIFTMQGHKEMQIISEGNFSIVPAGMTAQQASFTLLAVTCYNGILDANIKLMDNIVIIGMGTLGQLLLQMAKLSGAVVACADFFDERLNLAKKLGADYVINSSKDGELAEKVFEVFGYAADGVIEVTGNSKALSQAVRCVKKDAQVTVLSFYQNPPDNFQMGREFHSNRTTIKSSQIGGINPALSHRYDDERRMKASLELIAKMDVDSLVSHNCKFYEYPEMLKTISDNPSACKSVIIEY